MIYEFFKKAIRYTGRKESRIKKTKNQFLFFSEVEYSVISSFIKYEHPQTIALVISYLDKNKAALILEELDEELSSEVIMRISKMSTVSQHIIDKVANNMEKRLSILLEQKTEVGGANIARNILNEMNHDNAKTIVNNIGRIDVELSDTLYYNSKT